MRYACFLIYLYSCLLVTWEGMRCGRCYHSTYIRIYGELSKGGSLSVPSTAKPHPAPPVPPARSERGPCVQAC